MSKVECPRLTTLVRSSGCASKLCQADLTDVLHRLLVIPNENVLVGLGPADDAGVFRLRDDLALVQTVDFFTPTVDEPYMFGQIAAANALSDVYAMGGVPRTALSIVCFPSGTLDLAVLVEIAQGGLDKMQEAGAAVLGGHTVQDQELKCGYAVTGVIDPRAIVTNAGARPGDSLVLTKPLGVGVIVTALKAGVVDEPGLARAQQSMATLNRSASKVMQEVGVSACTDVTGFSILGHAYSMALASGVGIRLHSRSLPCIEAARELVMEGFASVGLYTNREFVREHVTIAPDVPEDIELLLYDPQTSGGLLISVGEEKAGCLLERLLEEGVGDACVVGEVLEQPAGAIRVD